MLPLMIALAQIVITGPAKPDWPPPPAHPKYIFSGYDYPAEAVRNRWEGTVVADLVIDQRGTPKSCSIVQSSGHKLLDDTTCALLIERAKFKPAKDKWGKPIEDKVRTPTVEWRLRN